MEMYLSALSIVFVISDKTFLIDILAKNLKDILGRFCRSAYHYFYRNIINRRLVNGLTQILNPITKYVPFEILKPLYLVFAFFLCKVFVDTVLD